MIRSFRCLETKRGFDGEHSRKFQAIERTALRKLMYLDQAVTLVDLAAIPGHRLEPLSGDRKGQYSIRVNDPYRVCFEWTEPDAFQVEITDYH